MVTRWPRPGWLPWRRRELPSSWGTPMPVCTCSSTPAGRAFLTTSETPAWPPLRERRRRRRRKTFEAQWHGFRTGCPRITRSVALHRARLASGRWSGAAGRASTRRVPSKGFQFTSCSLSSFPKPLGTIPLIIPVTGTISVLKHTCRLVHHGEIIRNLGRGFSPSGNFASTLTFVAAMTYIEKSGLCAMPCEWVVCGFRRKPLAGFDLCQN
jgi:hypothetical protein